MKWHSFAATLVIVAALATGCRESGSPTGVTAVAPSRPIWRTGSGDTSVFIKGFDGKIHRKYLGSALASRTAMTSEEVCTDLPPTPDDCPLEYDAAESDSYFATSVGTATGSEPLWFGEDMSQSGGPYECPPYISDPTFMVYVIEDGLDVTIAGHGTWTKVRNLTPTVYGVPQAEYAAPAGDHYSSTPFGRYTATGGTIKGTCFTVHVRTELGVGVYTGFVRWWDYTGNIERRSDDSYDGNDDRGWAFEDGSGSNGAGGDWEYAVDEYVNNGRCTAGWEVWVDGVLRCDADGNAH